MNKDCHGAPLTDERRRLTSAIAQTALEIGIPGTKITSYRPGELSTTAIIRKRVDGLKPREWPRHMFKSGGIERGLRLALNPHLTKLDEESRMRVARASWNDDPAFLSYDDCELLVRLSVLPPRGQTIIDLKEFVTVKGGA
jgi:hypothetical protein